MTECDLCKGTGKLLKPWYDTTGAMTGMTGDICFMCDGKGTIGEPMTNEEWLRNLSFNELARVLYCMIINGERIRPDLAYIKQWLKEKHE